MKASAMGLVDETGAGPSTFGNMPPLPEWPPAGSLGSNFMAMSPNFMSASPFGKSVDMVDMCSQLLHSGVKTPVAVKRTYAFQVTTDCVLYPAQLAEISAAAASCARDFICWPESHTFFLLATMLQSGCQEQGMTHCPTWGASETTC